MTTYKNSFGSTIIKGNFLNEDYADGSVQANAIFNRNVQVLGNLNLGNETGTVGAYTDTGGSITFKLNDVTYTISTTILKYLSTLSGDITSLFSAKQNTLSYDSVPTSLSSNSLTSGTIYTALQNYLTTSTASSTYATITNLALKAPLASPTFTGTVSGISTSMISGISNYATLASPTFTGTVSGITASMVGLGNVNNTSDATKLSNTQSNNNAWTGTNTFNSSLPTSTLTPSTSTELITKA